MMVWLPGTGSAAEPDYWAGGYVGGSLGLGADKGSELDYSNNPTGNLAMDGYMLGLRGGYDWTLHHVVTGLEAEVGYADVKGEAPCTNPVWTCAARVDQLVTVRGRLGLAHHDVLLYVAAGPLLGRVEVKTVSPAGTEYPDRVWRRGWAVGLGGELVFSQRMRGRLELAHMDLGRGDYVVDFGNTVSLDAKVTSLRIGTDWKF